jgi:hypothetical protein
MMRLRQQQRARTIRRGVVIRQLRAPTAQHLAKTALTTTKYACRYGAGTKAKHLSDIVADIMRRSLRGRHDKAARLKDPLWRPPAHLHNGPSTSTTMLF